MALGPLMIGLPGLELTGADRRRLVHPAVGGVALFTRNYENPHQIEALTSAIHALRDPPLLVAVDHEGGRVQRFREGFTELPPVRMLRPVFDHDPARAEAMAGQLGWLMAVELRTVGVDFSFAPVLDLDFGVSEVVGDRAFHQSPEAVASLGRAWCRGAHAGGMVSVGKHFPGHGGCAPDSHVAYPEDERRLVDLEAADLVPFRRLINNGLEAVMVSHVQYPAVDRTPAGYSRRWLGEILRQRLGFEGAIISDDLGMTAADTAGSLVERARSSIEAGCDMAIIGNEPEALSGVLDSPLPTAPAAALRLARLHGGARLRREHLELNPDYQQALRLAEWLRAGMTGELEV